MGLHLYSKTKVQEIVAHDPRTRRYFRKLKVNYPYNGAETVKEVAEQAGKRDVDLLQDLRKIIDSPLEEENIRFMEWPLDLLVDYLKKKHHRYLRDEIPVIQFYLDKVCRVHGKRHPELFEIRSLFQNAVSVLVTELEEEENFLFPLFLRLYQAKKQDERWQVVESGLPEMLKGIDDLQRQQRNFHITIARLSKGYSNPKDGCTSYRIGMQKLKGLGRDIEEQAHLKNNVLFPRALNLEAYFERQAKYQES